MDVRIIRNFSPTGTLESHSFKSRISLQEIWKIQKCAKANEYDQYCHPDITFHLTFTRVFTVGQALFWVLGVREWSKANSTGTGGREGRPWLQVQNFRGCEKLSIQDSSITAQY